MVDCYSSYATVYLRWFSCLGWLINVGGISVHVDSRIFFCCLPHIQKSCYMYNAHAKPCTSKKKSTRQNELAQKQATMFNEQPAQWPPYVENNSGILINTIEETHYWRRRNTKYSQEVWFGGRVSMKLVLKWAPIIIIHFRKSPKKRLALICYREFLFWRQS